MGDDQCRRMFRPREASSAKKGDLANCSRFCISSWFKCSIDRAASQTRRSCS